MFQLLLEIIPVHFVGTRYLKIYFETNKDTTTSFALQAGYAMN